MPQVLALLVVLLAGILPAQTLRLRTGGADSVLRLGGATNATPIVITTLTPHGFTDGTPVHAQLVRGNTAANGHWFADVLSATTFALYTATTGNGASFSGPAVGNGAWETNTGTVGRTAVYTPKAHPYRGWWAEPQVLAQIEDPDGAGSGVAPIVVTGTPCTTSDRSGCTQWDVMLGTVSGYVSPSATCDGKTAALCPTEQSRLTHQSVESGDVPMLLAQVWFGDRSRTRELNAALFYINHFPKTQNLGRFAGCFPGFVHCSYGSQNDWTSFRVAHFAQAFELVRSQMAAGDITAFGQAIFNGVGAGSFSNQLSRQAGEAFVTQGSKIVTFSGFSPVGVYAPGDYLWLRYTPRSHSIADGDLVNIVSDGAGVCNMTTTYATGYKAHYLKVTGASQSLLNGTWYTNEYTARTSAPFGINFQCAGVPAGTDTNAALTVTWTGLTSSGGEHVQVATVDSSTQITLVANIANLTYANAQARHIQHYKSVPWTTSHYGQMWYAAGHSDNPGGIVNARGKQALAFAMDAVQTTMTVDGTSNFLDPVPFYVKVDSEWIEVTAKSGNALTVVRGAFDSPITTHAVNRQVIWSRRVLGGEGGTGDYLITGDPRSNLIWTKIWGFWAASLSLIGDVAEAPTIAEKSFNYWYDYIFPVVNSSWTGVTGGSSTSGYDSGRWKDWHYAFEAGARFGFTTSALSFWDATCADVTYFPIYMGMPYNFVVTPRFSDSGANEQTIESDDMQGWAYSTLRCGGTVGAHGHYWWRNVSDFHTWVQQVQNFNGYEPQRQYLAYRPLWPAAVDYRSTLPTARVFNTVMSTTTQKPLGLLLSRGAWLDAASTHLTTYWPSPNYDHWAGYPGPGNYKIARCGGVCTGAAGRLFDDDAQAGMGSHSTTNYVEVGGVNNLIAMSVTYGQHGGQTNVLDRSWISGTAAYVRIDSTGAYKSAAAVTKASRQIVHLKQSGPHDYVIAYDDVTTSSSQAKTTRLYYRRENKSPLPTFSRSGADITFTDTMSTARISSRILLPTDTSKISTLSDTTYSNRVQIADGSTTNSQFLVVHRVSTNTADTMPTVATITSDSNFVALQISDATQARVVALSRNGAGTGCYSSASFTSTHSGTGRYLAGGLCAATYEVLRGGSQILSNIVVTSTTETVEFESTSGAIVIQQTGSVTIAQSPSSLNFSAAQGNSPASQTFTVSATGGSANLSLSSNQSWCVVSPLTGSASLVVTVAPSTASLAVGTHPCTVTINSPEASNSPQTLTATVTITGTGGSPDIITTTLPNCVQGNVYSQPLIVSGGTAPYTWSLASGSLPTGLTLAAATGVISGTCSTVGLSSFTPQVTDGASQTDATPPALTINVVGATLTFDGAQIDQNPATVFQTYSFELQASGGTAPYTFALAGGSGALPAGLTLGTAGAISGTATAIGDFPIEVCVTDATPETVCETGVLRAQALGSDIGVSARASNTAARVVVTRSGIASNALSVLIRSPQGTIAGQGTIPAGAARRAFVFTGLVASTSYSIEVAGASLAGVGAFQTLATGSTGATVSFKLNAPQGRGITHAKIDYGDTSSLGSNVIAACTTTCTVDLTRNAGPLYRRITWASDGSGTPVAVGEIESLIIQ